MSTLDMVLCWLLVALWVLFVASCGTIIILDFVYLLS